MNESNIQSDCRLLATLSYIPPLGLIFFFIERENRFLRFHGLQATFLMVFWIVFAVVYILLSGAIIWSLFMLWGIVFYIASAAVYLVLVILSVVCAVKAHRGQHFRLPLIGNIALNLAK